MLIMKRHAYIHRNNEFYQPKDISDSIDEIEELQRTLNIPAEVFSKKDIHTYVFPKSHEVLPLQGFKLHVSARIDNAELIKSIVLQYCWENGLVCKFVNRKSLLVVLGKSTERSAYGKFFTLYPPQDRWLTVGHALADLLSEFKGQAPVILSDRQIGQSIVSYRYGVFEGIAVNTATDLRVETTRMLRNPRTGELIQDIRQPWFELPEWVSDPEPTNKEEVFDPDNLMLNGCYQIQKAVSFSASGGTYLVNETTTDKKFLVKESRPHVAVDLKNEKDATDRLVHEFQMLKAIPAGIGPAAVEMFEQEENRFLAIEFIAGDSLSKVRSLPVERIVKIGFQLASAVRDLHAAGYGHGDVNPNNILVIDDDDFVKLVDFEASHKIGELPPSEVRTPGFSPHLSESETKKFGSSDIYGVGATLLYLIAPKDLNDILEFFPEAVDRYLTLAERQDAIPKGLGPLISDCLSADPPTASELCKRIANTEPKGKMPVRTAAELDIIRETPERLRSDAVKMMRYAQAKSDFTNNNHCFPAHPAAFETNHLNLAYGVTGTGLAFYECGRRFEDESFIETSSAVLKWVKTQNIYGRYPEDTVIPPGLYIGRSGIALFMARLGDIELASEIIKSVIPDVREGKAVLPAGLFTGDSGVALACLHMFDQTGDQYFLDSAIDIRRERIDDTKENASLGFGLRGTAGVAMLDLALYNHTGDSDTLDAGFKKIEKILSNASAIAKLRPDIYGRAGIVSCLRQFYQHVRQPSLVQEIQEFILKILPSDGDYIRQAVLPGLESAAGIGTAMLDTLPLFEDSNVRYAYLETLLAIVEMIEVFIKDEGGDGISIWEPRVATNFFNGATGIALFLVQLADTIDCEVFDLYPAREMRSPFFHEMCIRTACDG